jgi:hypothetical protein
MNMEEKVQFNVYIHPRTSEEFHRLVAEKHQIFKRGLVSHEAELALRQYIATHKSNKQHTHTNTKQEGYTDIQQTKLPSKVLTLKQQVCNYFVDSELYEEVPHSILDKHLKQAIAHIKGTDPRTIKHGINDLLQFGCIRPNGVHQYEFVQ